MAIKHRTCLEGSDEPRKFRTDGFQASTRRGHQDNVVKNGFGDFVCAILSALFEQRQSRAMQLLLMIMMLLLKARGRRLY